MLRSQYHSFKSKIGSSVGSLDASIMIFQKLKDGPNPEYFSSKKQILLDLLVRLEMNMREISIQKMKEMTVSSDYASVSFYELCHSTNFYNSASDYKISQGSVIAVDNFNKIIYEIGVLVNNSINAEALGKKHQIKNFLFNDTLGTIDEMRIQLELNYDTKRILYPVGKKNAFVDVMVILSEEDRSPSKNSLKSSLLTMARHESSTAARQEN